MAARWPCRPGKQDAVSASINANGRLHVFSSSTPFETGPTTYDVLDVIAMYEHAGDRHAAAKTIAEATDPTAWRAEQDRASLTVLVPPANVDPGTGEILHRTSDDNPVVATPNLTEEFWSARPVLAHIRQAAYSVWTWCLRRCSAKCSPVS